MSGLVSGNGYLLRDIAASSEPSPPHLERKHWYQYYLHSERGRTSLSEYRAELARLLWQEWSATWTFTEQEFEATRAAFDNADFVDVVVHSYRHRYGLAGGDPAYDDTERRNAEQPSNAVPTIVLDGEHDTVTPGSPGTRTSSTSLRSSTTAWSTRVTACRKRHRRSSPGRSSTCGADETGRVRLTRPTDSRTRRVRPSRAAGRAGQRVQRSWQRRP